jgi:predicted nucleic acid-binding Zn ribbon protein
MDDDRRLKEIYKARLKDAAAAKSKRRRMVEAGPKTLGYLLNSYFAKGGTPGAIERIEEARALLAWEHYVGPAAAQVSRALRIRNGALTVIVKDPMWMQQLSLLKHEILKKYHKDFPRLIIKTIFFTGQERGPMR